MGTPQKTHKKQKRWGPESTTNPKSTAVARETDRSPNLSEHLLPEPTHYAPRNADESIPCAQHANSIKKSGAMFWTLSFLWTTFTGGHMNASMQTSLANVQKNQPQKPVCT
jgi:hypothetical protein